MVRMRNNILSVYLLLLLRMPLFLWPQCADTSTWWRSALFCGSSRGQSTQRHCHHQSRADGIDHWCSGTAWEYKWMAMTSYLKTRAIVFLMGRFMSGFLLCSMGLKFLHRVVPFKGTYHHTFNWWFEEFSGESITEDARSGNNSLSLSLSLQFIFLEKKMKSIEIRM